VREEIVSGSVVGVWRWEEVALPSGYVPRDLLDRWARASTSTWVDARGEGDEEGMGVEEHEAGAAASGTRGGHDGRDGRRRGDELSDAWFRGASGGAVSRGGSWLAMDAGYVVARAERRRRGLVVRAEVRFCAA